MTHLSLFSGIGGLDLAAEQAGFKTVAFVEREPFCQRVLKKHWPEVPIYDDVTTFDGTRYRGVTVLSGGFPCQDISTANKTRQGLEGERSGLWFEMLRIIEQARPAFVIAENVRNLINMGIDVCLSGMEDIGYEATAIIVPAAGVGAWHKRDRCFIIGRNVDCDGKPSKPFNDEMAGEPTVSCADAHGMGRQQGDGQARSVGKLHDNRERIGQMEEQTGLNEFRRLSPNATSLCEPADSKESNLREPEPPRKHRLLSDFGERSRLFEPKLCGDIHGIPGGLDLTTRRLKALGNAVCPQQAAPLFQAIAKALA